MPSNLFAKRFANRFEDTEDHMGVTIRDISKRLNVSVSTVSYALNGGPRPVPPELRQRILEVAEEIGYRPNRLAQMLSTGRTNTVGVVPTGATPNFATAPFFQAVLNGITNAGERLRYDVLLFSAYDQREPEFPRNLVDGRVDGLILMAPRRDSPILEQVRSAKVPYVVIGSAGSPEAPDAPTLKCDNRQGARLAIDHLVELGHRKIALVAGPTNMDDGVQRNEAALERMRHHGVEPRPEWLIQGSFHPTDGPKALEKILALEDQPTAIFFGNDEMAFGFLQASYRRGIEIPRRFSIVGFDDAPLSSQCFPPLTTVRQPLVEMGLAAMSALTALIDGKPAPHLPLFPTELIVRHSTESPKEDPR